MSRAVHLLLVFLVACGGRTTANQPSLSRETEFTARLPAAAFVDRLDDRERREQMRDWAVLATLAHEGATPEQAAAATYQMPPVRLPYLDELYQFTYGRGRRAYLGDRVLLFVDADDPDRIATFGRLADQVRMELGEIPHTAELYVVDDLRDTGTLHIARSAIVEGSRLFSPEYGYVAGEATTADELAAWLAKVDDLSQVLIEPGKLVLGGRWFPATRTAGVTLEDVAALYQATKRIHERQDRMKSELDQLPTKYAEKAANRLAQMGYSDDSTSGQWDSDDSTSGQWEPPESVQNDVLAELKPQLDAEVHEISARGQGPSEPGFSLDPHWLPGPDAAHPLMLARLQQLAHDPCAEISRIASLAPKLLAAEPDEARRSGEAWAASELATSRISASTCGWLRGFLAERIRPAIIALEGAPPREWQDGFGPYYQLKKDLDVARAPLAVAQDHAVGAVLSALNFYEFETAVQCARYDETGGTAVGMTLFYTDLVAKLWQGIDYAHSAPIRPIPGFLTSTRMEISAAFLDELNHLTHTRLWFGVRTDAVSRKVDPRGPQLAFLHRFSRVYAAGRDPAQPRQESRPNERARRSIGWWDHHFDEIADYEPQYHRQNQIMKWSAVTAAMIKADVAPTFLDGVTVDRTARFFPWLTAHRDQLRFHELVPERPAPYATECIARLHSYWFREAGTSWFMSGGVSLANREVMEITPTLDMERQAGQRLVAAAEAETVPVQKLEGRIVSIANEDAARVRASSGPINLSRVMAKFEGRPGAPEITMNSQAGKVATIEIKPVEGGVRIDVRPDLVEHVRAAFDLAERRTVISFEGESARIVRSGDTLVEMRRVESASMDASDLAVGRDTLDGLRQARPIETDAVFQRMDAYEWQVIEPGGHIRPPRVRFGNAPPPASAREVPVRGVDGVATARMTEHGELYFARPIEADARASWHSLADRAELDPAFRAPIHDTLELSAQAEAKNPVLAADHMERSGRLEEAAPMLEHAMPAKPVTIEDHVRLALYDIGTRNQVAAKLELDALRARGLEVSPETRSLLVDGVRNHGQADVAELLDAELQGKPVPDGLSLVEDRGRIKVMYEARHIETVEVIGPHDGLDELFPPVKYIDQRLLVGREGFEPDFSGPITAWLHDPGLTVREMKVKPFDVAPGVIKDTATGQQFLRARDPGLEKFQGLPANMQRVYMIEPRQSDDQRCDHSKPRDAQNCADER